MFIKNTVVAAVIMLFICAGCGEKGPSEEKEENTKPEKETAENISSEDGTEENTSSEESTGGEESETEKEGDTEKDTTEQPAEGKLVHIHSPDEFKSLVLGAEKPCLVDFYSNQCPPCRILAPVIEKLAKEYQEKAVICKVSFDISENRSLAQKYGIRGIPTVIFFSKGKEANRIVGLRQENAYTAILNKLISESNSDKK